MRCTEGTSAVLGAQATLEVTSALQVADDIAQLVGMLRLECPVAQLHACRALSALSGLSALSALSQTKSHSYRIVKADGVTPIVGLLSHNDDEVKKAALKPLRRICMLWIADKDLKLLDYLKEADGVKAVIVLLSCANEKVQRKAARTLQEISSTDLGVAAVVTTGAIEPLVAILRTGAQKSKEEAVNTVQGILEQYNNTPKANLGPFLSAGIVVPLLALLQGDSSKSAQDFATGVLRVLGLCQSGRSAIISADGIAPLMGQLPGRDALDLLSTIAREDTTSHTAILSAGVAPLVELLAIKKHCMFEFLFSGSGITEVHELVASILKSLTAGTETSSRDAIVAAEGVPLLVRLLQKAGQMGSEQKRAKTVKYDVAETLLQLTSGGLACCAAITNADGGLASLVSLLHEAMDHIHDTSDEAAIQRERAVLSSLVAVAEADSSAPCKLVAVRPEAVGADRCVKRRLFDSLSEAIKTERKPETKMPPTVLRLLSLILLQHKDDDDSAITVMSPHPHRGATLPCPSETSQLTACEWLSLSLVGR
jgi:vacuolar protein 8